MVIYYLNYYCPIKTDSQYLTETSHFVTNGSSAISRSATPGRAPIINFFPCHYRIMPCLLRQAHEMTTGKLYSKRSQESPSVFLTKIINIKNGPYSAVKSSFIATIKPNNDLRPDPIGHNVAINAVAFIFASGIIDLIIHLHHSVS